MTITFYMLSIMILRGTQILSVVLPLVAGKILNNVLRRLSSKNSRLEIILSSGMCDVKCCSNKTAGLLGKTTSNCETSNSVTSVSYEASKTSYFLGKCQVDNIQYIWVYQTYKHAAAIPDYIRVQSWLTLCRGKDNCCVTLNSTTIP